jgi:hypothetical protein
VKLVPEAGEGTLTEILRPTGLAGEGGGQLPKRTPEEIEAESSWRAAREVRRLVRAHRLRLMWTFTFAQAVHDWEELVAYIDRFRDRYRRRLGAPGAPLLIPEPHPGGHGWHLHGATDRFISIEVMRECWPWGYVWVGDDGHKVGPTTSRELAAYLAKYVSKALGEEELHGCSARPPGSKRYFTPDWGPLEEISVEFVRLDEARDWLARNYGRPDVEKPFGWDGKWPVRGWAYTFPDAVIRAWKKARPGRQPSAARAALTAPAPSRPP